MKIAILGGGFTGLTAAYDLQKKGHAVTLFEKEPVLGGLAVGFKQPNWDWYLERAYHHLFANDREILNFAKEIGFGDIYLNSPETASLYEIPAGFPQVSRTPRRYVHKSERSFEGRVIPLDSPQDLLRFPYLSLRDKLRAGMVLAFLKTSPFLSLYEKQTAEEFIKKYMGERVWNVLWQELFRKKFGKYAENILSSFIWARINKRTKNLAYIRGGFQTFIDHIEKMNAKIGIETKKGVTVEGIVKKGKGFWVQGGEYDILISTLPSLLLPKVASNILPQNYLTRFQKLNYLHAVVLILETKLPLLEKAYWLNISTPKLPVMGVMQHTNFIDKKYYGGNHILYAANYVDFDNKLIKMNDKEVLDWYSPQLKKINSKFEIRNSKFFVFKGPFAQPIFDKEFVKNKPDFITPVKNFYIANLDMTYPYDRGTNYAVKLGRDVAKLI